MKRRNCLSLRSLDSFFLHRTQLGVVRFSVLAETLLPVKDVSLRQLLNTCATSLVSKDRVVLHFPVTEILYDLIAQLTFVQRPCQLRLSRLANRVFLAIAARIPSCFPLRNLNNFLELLFFRSLSLIQNSNLLHDSRIILS